jgi:hypothetical protein
MTGLVAVLVLSVPAAGQLPLSADSAAWRALRAKELQRESLSKWVRADSGSTHRSLEPVVALAIVGMPLGTIIGGLSAPRPHCSACGATSGPTKQAMIIGGSIGTALGAGIGWIFFSVRPNSSGR